MGRGRERLLVFNCHEAWVYQLGLLDYDLDIICGLSGRYTRGWDSHIRPVPDRARLIRLEEALASPERYTCIIAHNLTDLLDIRGRPEPRILILHLALEARIVEERPRLHAEQAKQLMHRYAELGAVHVVAVSHSKGRSWGFTEDIVPFAVDSADYPPCTGEIACGLRISNFVQQRKASLHWPFHERAFGGLPVRIVGHNPGMAGVAPSGDWDHLKALLRTCRFYIHTAHPDLEDGYNMATVEAMAAGLPVLGNKHPTSVVEHGVNGFVSDDPDGLRDYARLLLDDRDLALRMGRQARLTVEQRFSVEAFQSGMGRAIASARMKRECLGTHGPHTLTAGTGTDAGRQTHPVRSKRRIVELPREPGRISSAAQTESPGTTPGRGR